MKKICGTVIACILVCMFFPLYTAKAEELSNPKIMLTGYSVEESVSVSGDTMVHLDFTNMSKLHELSEILITYTSPNNTVAPVFGVTNQIYIEKLDAEETSRVNLPVVLLEAGTQYARMDFNIQYTYGGSKNAQNYSYIVFLKQRDGNLTITNTNIARSTTVGAQTIASISYRNNSSITMYNAKIHFTGGIEEKEVYIGTVGAGGSGYSENYVVFKETGTQNLTVYMTYENAGGIETVVEGETYSIQVDEIDNGTDQNPNGTDDELQGENQVYSYGVLIIITAIVVFILIMAFLNRKKK